MKMDITSAAMCADEMYVALTDSRAAVDSVAEVVSDVLPNIEFAILPCTFAIFNARRHRRAARGPVQGTECVEAAGWARVVLDAVMQTCMLAVCGDEFQTSQQTRLGICSLLLYAIRAGLFVVSNSRFDDSSTSFAQLGDGNHANGYRVVRKRDVVLTDRAFVLLRRVLGTLLGHEEVRKQLGASSSALRKKYPSVFVGAASSWADGYQLCEFQTACSAMVTSAALNDAQIHRLLQASLILLQGVVPDYRNNSSEGNLWFYSSDLSVHTTGSICVAMQYVAAAAKRNGALDLKKLNVALLE